MLKKTLSIILSVIMLVMLIPAMPALAALPTAALVIADDGSVTTEGVAYDDFNRYTTELSGFNAYPSGANGASSVFKDGTGSSGAFNLVKHADASGAESMMLKLASKEWDSANIPVKTIQYKSGQLVRFSYDIYFDTLPADNANYTYIGANNTNYNLRFDPTAGDKILLQGSYSGRTYKLTEDTWYKIVVTVNAAGEQIVYLTDYSTGEIYLYSDKTTYSVGSSLDLYAALITYHLPAPTILIDNVELLVYTPSETYAPSVLKTSTGSSGVPANAGTMEITFDQPIKTAPEKVSLTAEGKTALTATVSAVSNKLNTYLLTLPAMEENTTYTAVLSGFLNDADVGGESYSFTTAAATPLLTATPANGATGVSVETKTMTLTFDQEMVTAPGWVTLSGGAEISATVTTEDKKVFTLSWSEDLASNTTYSLSLADFKNAAGIASATASVSFTTENTDIIKLTDSFEDASLIENGGYQYNSAGNPEKSPLMMITGNWDCQITQVEGYTSGTKAFQLKAGSDWRDYLKTTVKYAASDELKLVATYRLRVDELATDNTLIALGGTYGGEYAPGRYDTITAIQTADLDKDGTKELLVYSDNDDYDTARGIEEDKWYNITYVSGLSNQSIYVVDAQTGILIYEKTSGHFSGSFSETENYIVPYTAQTTGGNNAGLVTTIDDFTLWQINSSKPSHKLALDGNITGADGTYTMRFNQPVAGNKDMLKVAEATGSAPAESNNYIDFAAEITYPDFCAQTVSFSGLPYKSPFMLDYSGLTAASGVGFAEPASCLYSFTSGIDTTGTITLVGTANYEAPTVSFTLYNDGAAAEAVKAYVAFYQGGELCGVATPDSGVTVSGKSEQSVSVSAAAYSSFDSIKVFVWNSELMPLMSVHNRTIAASVE